jgi:hypothetical protein
VPLVHDVLLVHAAATLVLAGVMWAIQLTIVPVMERDTAESWPHHAWLHRRVFLALFWPLLVVEGASGVAAAALQPVGVPAWLHGVNLALLSCAWITVPVIRFAVGHAPAAQFNPPGFRRYARLNWIRVFVWTARAAVVITMLHVAGAIGG